MKKQRSNNKFLKIAAVSLALLALPPLAALPILGGGEDVGEIGMAVAAIAGGTVARTGLRPVARLTEATERVARTDDLRPIPVYGNDELARLTEAFNMMLRALA